MKNGQAETFCLNPQYSTTRMVAKEPPSVENDPSSKVHTALLLPPHPQRQGEGGLRIKGIVKKSPDNMPLVSVITVVFQGEEHLEQTIKSVVNQSYDNVEYIIIDGGSSDGTIDIIKKYEDAIDYWVSEKDSGIYDAMNKGINQASGSWINFMNGGDIFFKNETLELIAPQLEGKGIAGFYSDCEVVYPSSIKKILETVKFTKLWQGMPFSHQSFIARTDVLKQNQFSLKYHLCADFDQLMAMLQQGQVVKKLPNIVCSVAADGVADSNRAKVLSECYEISLINSAQHKAILFWNFKFRELDNFLRIFAKSILPRKIINFIIKHK
ncbi:glycosyltransferase [Candidatus Pacearchaeota archaeon]|nr:glycosyltransferase [Candidatus Pacearchaeota archaeon]